MSQKVLEAEDVEVIYSRLCKGDRGARIAEDFAISQQSVSAIKCGKSWGHVTGLGEPLNPRNRVTRAILTEIQVLAIDAALKDGKATQRDLARRYGVSDATIFGIKTGQTWQWLTGNGKES